MPQAAAIRPAVGDSGIEAMIPGQWGHHAGELFTKEACDDARFIATLPGATDLLECLEHEHNTVVRLCQELQLDLENCKSLLEALEQRHMVARHPKWWEITHRGEEALAAHQNIPSA